MNRYAWVIKWEDLSAVCFTKEDAINYVNREAKRMEAKIEWCENENFPDVIGFYCTLKNSITEIAYEMYLLPIIEY